MKRRATEIIKVEVMIEAMDIITAVRKDNRFSKFSRRGGRSTSCQRLQQYTRAEERSKTSLEYSHDKLVAQYAHDSSYNVVATPRGDDVAAVLERFRAGLDLLHLTGETRQSRGSMPLIAII